MKKFARPPFMQLRRMMTTLLNQHQSVKGITLNILFSISLFLFQIRYPVAAASAAAAGKRF